MVLLYNIFCYPASTGNIFQLLLSAVILFTFSSYCTVTLLSENARHTVLANGDKSVLSMGSEKHKVTAGTVWGGTKLEVWWRMRTRGHSSRLLIQSGRSPGRTEPFEQNWAWINTNGRPCIWPDRMESSLQCGEAGTHLESRDSGKVTRMDNSRQMAEAEKQVRHYGSMRKMRNGKIAVRFFIKKQVTVTRYCNTVMCPCRQVGSESRGEHWTWLSLSLHTLVAPLLLQSPWLSCIPEISPPTGFLFAAGSRMQLAELTWLWALWSHGPVQHRVSYRNPIAAVSDKLCHSENSYCQFLKLLCHYFVSETV